MAGRSFVVGKHSAVDRGLMILRELAVRSSVAGRDSAAGRPLQGLPGHYVAVDSFAADRNSPSPVLERKA